MAELHIVSHEFNSAGTVMVFGRLETGLGLNDKGVIQDGFVSIRNVSPSVDFNAEIALIADPDYDNTSIRMMHDSPSVLWSYKPHVRFQDMVQVRLSFLKGVEFPGDLLLGHIVDANVMQAVITLYYTKKRSSNNDKAIMMMKYGIKPNTRDNIEETGAKSPFSDV